MILGVVICLVSVHGLPNPQDDYDYDYGDDDFGCQCTSKRYLNKNTDEYHGNCLTAHRNGKYWCYVEIGDNSCCQGKTARFKKTHCVNFDLCNTDYVDGEENNERSPGALSSPKRKRRRKKNKNKRRRKDPGS